MLIDSNLLDHSTDRISADIVIVGAGTVGLFLAAYLLKLGVSANIVLVEAGNRTATTDFNVMSAASTAKPHRGTALGRAMGLGGTSSLWGGQLAKFDRMDLQRADAPWPIDFDELQGLYRQVYDLLGLRDVPSDDFYRKRLGAETAESGAADRFFTHWLKEPNFARVFKDIITSDSLRVFVNLTAYGIKFRNSTAISLTCRTKAGRELILEASGFVFAAGTIPTTRFFLSTQRDVEAPWKNNPLIGRYFQDHLGGRIGYLEVLNEGLFRDYFENAFVGHHKVQPKLKLTDRSRGEVESGACVFFSFESSTAAQLSNLKLLLRGLRAGLTFSTGISLAKDFWGLGRSLAPVALRFIKDRRIFSFFDKGISVLVQAEQLPIVESRIVLLDDRPASDGLFKVGVEWRCDGREINAIRRMAADADRYLQDKGIAKLHIEPALLSDSSDFLDKLADTYHQCGGMRMSVTPADGVVDSDCRVWGTENVWISGAAVFPTSSHANCTLTALAMTARLAVTLARL